MADLVPRELFDSELSSVRREISSLEKLLNTQIGAVEDSAKLALDAADKAAVKADNAFEKRMDTTNEWRGALDDQTKRMATIQMFETLKEAVDKIEVRLRDRIDATEKKLDAMLNKVIGFGLLITVIVGIVAIGGNLLRA